MVLLRKTLYILVLVILLASCANRGIGPQGGPKDSIPPVPLKYEPEMGALEFKGKKIEVTFDEYLQLDNIAQNLLMSPPQQTPPDVKARGKKLIVQFQDTLRDSTTYTIDFGSAVCDFREKVPLRGFNYYFSTGSTIDTLEYTGFVYDAENLTPRPSVFVGIHEILDDSAFTKEPFLRVARTDSVGFFRIGNMRPGTYRLYAVDDISRDYRFTPGEAIAYHDETITPMDSTSAIMYLFKEQQQKLYMQRTTRDEQHLIRLSFSAPPDSLPELRFMKDSLPIELNYHTQYSRHNDTITLWLLDSAAIAIDSLFIEARYRRTDSVYQLEWATDTLRAIWRAPKLTAKAQAAQERKNRNRRLELRSNARTGFEMYDTLRLTCTTPLAAIERDSIHLFERVDTVLKPVKFTIADHDTLPMELRFIADLKPDQQYELKIDSGALHDIYGVTHIAGTYTLKLKTPADYSTLRVKLNPFVEHARIQVLDKQDKVVRELPAVSEGAFFEYLKPDTYYLRFYVDENEDGQWTTGSWDAKRQPEAVFYFPEKIQTKSNWDFEEEWDYTAVEQVKAKPAELIKASMNAKK